MTTYEESRRAFDQYAGMDHPHLPDNKWSALQVLHCRWSVDNFGIQDVRDLALGISEETCRELPLAKFKSDPEEVKDACADVLIFSTGLATLCRLDFGILVETAPDRHKSEDPFDSAILVSGRISQLTLKLQQKIRGINRETYREGVAEEIGKMWWALSRISKDYFFSLPEAYFETAARVMKRDWNSNRITG